MVQVRWMRKRQPWWARLLTLESAIVALCGAILLLLALMAELG